MRSLRNSLAALGVILLGVMLPLELLLGYVRFRQLVGGSALKHWSLLSAASFLDGRRVETPRAISLAPPDERETPSPREDRNPFVRYANQSGYRFHPFIDYSGVHGTHPDSISLDYFGFRNWRNLYAAPRARKLVVITGGSEVAGYTHRVPIAENLERILNRHEPGAYRVLNLGMNSYTLPNEINAYVHLAYSLRPDFVVSHTGYNDIMYGLMVPPGFKRLGLNYLKNIEDSWLPRLYDLKEGPRAGWSLDERETESIVGAVLANIEKYRNFVTHNRGTFIVGIQPYQREAHRGAGPVELFRKGEELLDRINAEASRHGIHTFGSLAGLGFHDHIHTNEESSLKLAQFYANEILRLLNRSKKLTVSRR